MVVVGFECPHGLCGHVKERTVDRSIRSAYPGSPSDSNSRELHACVVSRSRFGAIVKRRAAGPRPSIPRAESLARRVAEIGQSREHAAVLRWTGVQSELLEDGGDVFLHGGVTDHERFGDAVV